MPLVSVWCRIEDLSSGPGRGESHASIRASRGCSSVGRASASQAEGRGFEPRRPLLQASSTKRLRSLFVATPGTGSGAGYSGAIYARWYWDILGTSRRDCHKHRHVALTPVRLAFDTRHDAEGRAVLQRHGFVPHRVSRQLAVPAREEDQGGEPWREAEAGTATWSKCQVCAGLNARRRELERLAQRRRSRSVWLRFGLTLSAIGAGLFVTGSTAAVPLARQGSGSCASRGAIVLGAEPRFSPDNWGVCKPHWFSNGGDESGTVWNIHWNSWGGPVATGHGLNGIFTPQGGYYPPVVIYLRAFDIGRCSPTWPRAYLHLQVREPSRPGGPLGPWHEWGGRWNESSGRGTECVR
jgi:hypothetical protein